MNVKILELGILEVRQRYWWGRCLSCCAFAEAAYLHQTTEKKGEATSNELQSAADRGDRVTGAETLLARARAVQQGSLGTTGDAASAGEDTAMRMGRDATEGCGRVEHLCHGQTLGIGSGGTGERRGLAGRLAASLAHLAWNQHMPSTWVSQLTGV